MAQVFITQRKERPNTLGFIINQSKSETSGSGAA